MPYPAPAAPNNVYFCDPALMAAQAQGRSPLPIVGAYPPMWEVRPPGAQDLYGTGRATLLGVAGDVQTIVPAPAFTILPAYEGVISELRMAVTLPTFGTLIQFSLLINDAPVLGWTNLTPPDVAAALVAITREGPLQLQPGDNLTVRVVNVNGTGPFNVQADLTGWQYAQNLRRAIYGDAANS